jgi:hypothetical protein
MSITMALADGGAMDMADCDGRGAGDMSGTPCDMACIAPFVANVGAEVAAASPLSVRTATWGPGDFSGRTGAPNPDPPRTLIPS